MKETYTVKLPQNIVFGDPLYFEQFNGEKLERLVVDFSPPKHFEAKVVLQEIPFEEMPHVMDRTMTIFLAPAKTMGVYLNDMIFESQDENTRDIGVDTAQYILKIDDNEEIIRTGADGYWGSYMELSRTVNGCKTLDAAIISVSMPEQESFDTMRERLNFLFSNVIQTENAREIEIMDTSENSHFSQNGFSLTQQ